MVAPKIYSSQEERLAARRERDRLSRDHERDAARAREYYARNREQIKERMRKYAKEYGKEYRQRAGCGTWVLVSDPDSEAAIAPGFEMSATEKCAMLIYGSFTPGSVLAYRKYRYCVTGAVGTHQRLEAI